MKRALALGAVTGLLAFGIAPAAQAGEITGGKNPKPTPIKVGTKSGKIPSASLCAFSGIDDLTEGQDATPATRPRLTQSWGQESKATREFLISIGFGPGTACKIKITDEEPPA